MTGRMHIFRAVFVTLVVALVSVGTVDRAEADMIFNGKYNTVVHFGLEGDTSERNRTYEFNVVETGDLHFNVGCEDQSEMSVTLRGYADAHKKSSPVPFVSERSHEAAVFTFSIDEKHLSAVKAWEVQVTSKWAMPTCNLDLHHNERVTMFRSTARDGDAPVSLRSNDEGKPGKWANTPFVVWIAPRQDDEVGCARP